MPKAEKSYGRILKTILERSKIALKAGIRVDGLMRVFSKDSEPAEFLIEELDPGWMLDRLPLGIVPANTMSSVRLAKPSELFTYVDVAKSGGLANVHRLFDAEGFICSYRMEMHVLVQMYPSISEAYSSFGRPPVEAPSPIPGEDFVRALLPAGLDYERLEIASGHIRVYLKPEERDVISLIGDLKTCGFGAEPFTGGK